MGPGALFPDADDLPPSGVRIAEMPDSLFPSYDGSTPGDNPETSVDITDIPLEPLFAESSSLSEPGASQVTEFEPPEPVQAAPAAAPGAAGAFGQAGNDPGARGSGLQSRIDKLTRARYDSERQNNQLNEQIAALSQGLMAANARIAQLTAPRPAPGSSSGLFDTVGSQPGITPPAFDEARIGDLMDRRLQPVVQMFQDQAQGQNLRMEQERSFNEAAREYPDLARADSEMRQVFNKLFDGSPLKGMPDAPYQVALQSRGLLADVRRERQATVTRKTAAGVQVPHTPDPARASAQSADGVPAGEMALRKTNLEKMRNGTATQAERMQVLRVNQFLLHRKG